MNQLSGATFEDVFADRVLADYSVIIDAVNPNATNYNESQVERDRARLLDFFEVIPVETTPDKFETALIIEEAMANIAPQCVIRARTGDGGNGGLVRAAMGRGVPLWQESDGMANNLGRASFGLIDRNELNLKKIIDNARIAITSTIFCTITSPEGRVVYQEYLADQFDIGDMANAQMAREDKEHRDRLKNASRIGGLIHTGIVGGQAIIAASDFKIVREKPSIAVELEPAINLSENEIDPNKVEVYNELAFTNLKHIAKFGRVRRAHMTARKMVEFSDHYKTLIGPFLHYAKLYSFGVTGRDVPDGEQIQFRMLSDANAQGSGDPFIIKANSRVNIQRNGKPLLVVSNRRRP